MTSLDRVGGAQGLYKLESSYLGFCAQMDGFWRRFGAKKSMKLPFVLQWLIPEHKKEKLRQDRNEVQLLRSRQCGKETANASEAGSSGARSAESSLGQMGAWAGCITRRT